MLDGNTHSQSKAEAEGLGMGGGRRKAERRVGAKLAVCMVLVSF
jgi:hypothetical protein